MELLTPAFIILIVKISISVMPGVFGIFVLSLSEEKKRELRDAFCKRLLGVRNAIPYRNFERSLLVLGILALLFSAAAIWFLLLRGLIN